MDFNIKEQINCILSLKHRALASIAIGLWKSHDVGDLVSSIYCSETKSDVYNRNRKWQEVEDFVIQKVFKLKLPKSQKEKLSKFVSAAGWEIFIWVLHHEHLVKIDRRNFNKLCWTAKGTIDRRKTAAVFVREENINICVTPNGKYTLKNSICTLWQQLQNSYETDVKMQRSVFMCLWERIVKEEQSEYCRDDNVIHYNYAFLRAVANGDEAETRYFWQKLTPGEREQILVLATQKITIICTPLFENMFIQENFIDVLFFLFTEMSTAQQLLTFQKYGCNILLFFLVWPFQDLFMEVSQQLYNCLSPCYYDCVLMEIYKKVPLCRDYNYRKLFGTFWQQSLMRHKKYVINELLSHGTLLLHLFHMEDTENIKLIFDYATIEEKSKCGLLCCWLDICENLIYDDKWEMLEFLIRECLSSKTDVQTFKDIYKEKFSVFKDFRKSSFSKMDNIRYILQRLEHKTSPHCNSKFQLKQEKKDRFFKLLDNIICGYEKRKCEEGCNCPEKKLHSTEREEAEHDVI